MDIWLVNHASLICYWMTRYASYNSANNAENNAALSVGFPQVWTSKGWSKARLIGPGVMTNTPFPDPSSSCKKEWRDIKNYYFFCYTYPFISDHCKLFFRRFALNMYSRLEATRPWLALRLLVQSGTAFNSDTWERILCNNIINRKLIKQ